MARKTGVQINTNPYGQDIKQSFKDIIIFQIFTCNNAMNTFMLNPLGTINVIDTFRDLIVSYFNANDIYITKETIKGKEIEKDTSKRKYRSRHLTALKELDQENDLLLTRIRRNPSLLETSNKVRNDYRIYVHDLYTALLQIIQSGGLLSIKQELIDEA